MIKRNECPACKDVHGNTQLLSCHIIKKRDRAHEDFREDPENKELIKRLNRACLGERIDIAGQTTLTQYA